MDAIQAILSRRSVRAYQDRAVEPDKLDALLECAINAPSTNNAQNWHFTLITDGALLRAFEDAFSAHARELDGEWRARIVGGYRVLHGAPAAILISAPNARDINAGIAAENVCIAAQALGLGSCMIGLVRVVFSSGEGEEWARRLCCPEGLTPALMVTLGYPAPGGTRERVNRDGLVSRL
ncbi:MAG: nitroreductase family protein [Candidatus Fimadaptatus sp.]